MESAAASDSDIEVLSEYEHVADPPDEVSSDESQGQCSDAEVDDVSHATSSAHESDESVLEPEGSPQPRRSNSGGAIGLDDNDIDDHLFVDSEVYSTYKGLGKLPIFCS